MEKEVKNVKVEYIGYGLFESSIPGLDTRGIGNSKLDSLIDLLKNIQDKEETYTSLECSINIAV